ncbi:MAG: hypothetical protein E7256_07300 [Lachnospiraceae bacterium]|nr:hypothetical protein [Lachnospiraceae bacterium]
MMALLEFRERLRAIYQKYQLFIDPAVKFIVALFVFTMINRAIGYDTRLTNIVVVLLLSALSAFTPSAVVVLLAMAVSIVHIYSVTKILTFLIAIVFLVLYCLFLHFTPKYGYVVLAIPILYTLHIPYVVPLVLGLIATPITILPTACGVFVYYLFAIVKEEAVTGVSTSLDDTLLLYTRVIDKIMDNKQLFMSIIIFALIIVVVYAVRKLKIEYAFEIAVGAGAVACILGFLIVDLRLDISKQIGTMILGTIGSAAIAIIIQFFRRALDYTAVENVQFEDDDYYYYVKAVPKINVSMPQMRVKRINAQKVSDTVKSDPIKDQD